MNRNLRGIQACVFDAYGTLFDVNSAVHAAEKSLGEKSKPLAALWREKQLQYTWLRSLSGHYVDFWQVTADALDFALATMKIDNATLRAELMNAYLSPSVYPEVPATLERLKAAGMTLAILSNGTSAMLSSAVQRSGIAPLLNAILSVEDLKVYKPHASVYRLACERLSLAANEICFVSSNGWDAYPAKAFGFHVVWCNRSQQAAEKIPETPDAEILLLSDLPYIVLG